ncbi:hypothetical protein ACFQ23_05550 [Schaalia naturae]|uniref:Tetratricopeptide repeat protein n=1 Tax=Schaalia naturae TaxID=635203 RepID=A0ABW2SK33_9ACTO
MPSETGNAGPGPGPAGRGKAGDDADLLPFGAPASVPGAQGESSASSSGSREGGRGRIVRPRRRSRAALRPLWWSLPVIVLMLAAAVFLIGLHLWSYQSGRAYQDDRFSAAREGYQGQMAATAHGPERWVADYNLGTTLLAQGWLDTGVDYLQRAMERVPRATEVAEGYLEAYSYECRVRTNLALGLEAQGDVQTTAREWSQAVELYERSSDLLGPCQAEGSGQQSGGSGGQSGQSGEGQQSGQSGQSGDAQTDPGEQAGSAKDRVDGKAQDARDRAEGREPSPSPSDGSGGSGSGPDEADAPGSPGSSSPEPSPGASTPDPFAGETEAERERREQLEDRLRGSDSDQEDDYDQNRPGLSNGGW